MSIVMVSRMNCILAWQQICEHVTHEDILEIGDIDEADFVAAIIGLLVQSGYEPDDAEQLLIKAGLIDKKAVQL